MNYMYRLPKANCQIERVIADLRVLRRTDWEVAGGFLFLTAPAKRVNIIYREEPLSKVLKQVAAKRVKVLKLVANAD